MAQYFMEHGYNKSLVESKEKEMTIKMEELLRKKGGVIKGESFNHPSKGHVIKLHDFVTCITTGVIYMLKCPYRKAYVGKTKRAIRKRIGEHKRTTSNCDLEKQKYVTPVSRHFRVQGHNSNQLKWLVLQVVSVSPSGGDYNRILLQKETMWIDQLNKHHDPYGT
ncbi:hypothetical protein XELAEV_18042244mg [Xenopus laevis]|uniref:GIY-YIG domain-containing protein n=1 Tax=Xenopus laevis TaxID=8355 RepID=A0A974H656_XENLA|nr:hypothetical protein XELAEV_18042244mg [Xenopus laevis]